MLAIFYRAVVRAILLYGSETWVLSAAMERNTERVHTGFLLQITGKQARQLRDGTRETPDAEGVREAAGMQSARTYIGIQQATMAQWVALRPLFEVCARETLYKGGGHKRDAWWRQEAPEKQIRATLADLRKDKRRRHGRENVTQ